MSFLIPTPLIFKTPRHTALFILIELYKTILNRIPKESESRLEQILDSLLNQDSEKSFTNSTETEDLIVIRFIKFYLEFNHISERFHRLYLSKEKHLLPKIMSEFDEALPNIDADEFKKFLNQIEIDLVFTAHPTEIFERKILKKYIQLHKNLKKLFVSMNYKENSNLTKERKSILLSLWLTSDFNQKRPTPKDEAKLGQLIFQYSLWNGLTQFKKRFYTKLRAKKLPLDSNTNIIKYSSWMGSDRDGNPFVTTDATLSVIHSFAKKSISLYFREFKRLKEELCFEIKIGHEIIPVEKKIENLQSLLSEIIKKNYSIELIKSTEKIIISELESLYDGLKKYNAKFLADRKLRSLLDRLQAFGLLGLRWDLRQESAHHDHLVDEMFKLELKKPFSQLNETERLEFLKNLKTYFLNSKELKSSLNLEQKFESTSLSFESKDFLQSLQMIKKLGPDVIPYYIISMTRSASDLLLLQKFFEIFEIETAVVPLFETLEDLDNSSRILESFLSLNTNVKSITPVMLGYSDSAKTGSRLSSVWNLYLAQKKLVQIGLQHKTQIQFFHGRGGSIGRGGGPVQHAIASCPPESLDRGFRMTIQGEVIFDRFGYSAIAVQSMLTYAFSLLSYKFSKKNDLSNVKKFEQIFFELSEASKVKYRELINADGFMDYFDSVTPVKYMGDLNIGSRPTKRNSAKKSYRAIPWIFGWTQNRCLLPSWYGAGTALKMISEKYTADELKDMYATFFLFRSTLDLIYMTFLKIQMEIFKKYNDTLSGSNDFYDDILDEYHLLKKHLLEIVDPQKINHVNLEDKLYGRLEILDHLHNIQIQYLKKSKDSNDTLNEDDKKILLLSIQALASGMGNTG